MTHNWDTAHHQSFEAVVRCGINLCRLLAQSASSLLRTKLTAVEGKADSPLALRIGANDPTRT